MPWGFILGGALGGLGSIVGAGISSSAATSAANTQAQTAQEAIKAQQQAQDQAQMRLSPYEAVGQNALQQLYSAINNNGYILQNPVTFNGPNPQVGYLGNQPQLNLPPNLTTPKYNYTPLTLGTFQQSPGYQYQYNQILQGAQNAYAGKNGALSGNMLTGLQQQSAGLANQDWWNANNFDFNKYNTQYNANYQSTLDEYNAANQASLNRYNAGNQGYTQTQNILGNAYNQQVQGTAQQQSAITNLLALLSGSGQNAANSLGAFGQASAGQVGNYLTQGGNALASGQIGVANAINQGITGLTTSLGSSSPYSNPYTTGMGPFGNSNAGNMLNYLYANAAYGPGYFTGQDYTSSQDYGLPG